VLYNKLHLIRSWNSSIVFWPLTYIFFMAQHFHFTSFLCPAFSVILRWSKFGVFERNWKLLVDMLVTVGVDCTEDVDECESLPCQNSGTCHNEFGGYTCVCVNGWEGDNCSINIDDCADNPCYNGGTCHDHVASFYCECPRGKTGNCTLSYLLETRYAVVKLNCWLLMGFLQIVSVSDARSVLLSLHVGRITL